MWWIQLEGPVYWAVFVASFLAIAIWESFQPRRDLSATPERRWLSNGTLLFVSTTMAAVVLRLSPVLVTAGASGNRFGLLNQPWLPFGVRCLLAVLLLDLVHYGIHWSYHHVSFLWRIHEVHHSDQDYDVSTAFRFHPLEVLFGQAVYLIAIVALAPPATGVFIGQILTVVINFLAHANASLPPAAERVVRAAFVTPDMHRIHHSVEMSDQWRNLGQTFPWWDRLFGTYRQEAAAGSDFATGVEELRSDETTGLAYVLSEPFHSRKVVKRDPVPNPDLSS